MCLGCILPDSDVKDVAAHRAWHSHVSKSLPGNDDAGDQIRDAGSCGQHSNPHHLKKKEKDFDFLLKPMYSFGKEWEKKIL